MKTMVLRHLLNQLLHTFISEARVDKKGEVAMLYYNAHQFKQLSEGKFNSSIHVALQVSFLCSPSMYEICMKFCSRTKKRVDRKTSN